MKFATPPPLLAITALVIANPVASPVASPVADPVALPQATLPPVDHPDCTDCENTFKKCKNSWVCWFNPQACDVSCRNDTCRAYNGFCKENCGWNSC